jgi:hypothetical protein
LDVSTETAPAPVATAGTSLRPKPFLTVSIDSPPIGVGGCAIVSKYVHFQPSDALSFLVPRSRSRDFCRSFFLPPFFFVQSSYMESQTLQPRRCSSFGADTDCFIRFCSAVGCGGGAAQPWVFYPQPEASSPCSSSWTWLRPWILHYGTFPRSLSALGDFF